MLWLSVHLPHAPLEAWLPLPAEALAQGVCVVERVGSQAAVVIAASAAARAVGVQPGLGAATAAALAPQVQQILRDTRREAALVEGLALALGRYTPQVVLEPDGVLLELQASLRLFGGVPALLHAVRGTVHDSQLTPRLGLAPTPLAATVLARVGRRPGRALQMARLHRLLQALPVQASLRWLGLEARSLPALDELLEGIGCHTLGAVRALPRTALSRRAGGALLAALDRAWGERPDPRALYVPPPTWRAELELMHRADDAAMLIFAVQRLLQPLAGWLARQWLAASRFSLHLQHEDHGREPRPDTVLHIELAQPSREAPQLLALLRERLQRLPLPAPVYRLALVLDTVQAHAGQQAQWLPNAQAQAEGWAALLDRLRARLGTQAVRRLSLHADHRPERAMRALPSGAEPAPGPSGPLVAAEPDRHRAPTLAHAHAALGSTAHSPPRPTWLLPEPLPLHTLHGQPVHGGPLTLLAGPERIEAGWFDGGLAVRDYHVAAGADHRLRWIFREGHAPGAAGASGHEARWFLQGWFA